MKLLLLCCGERRLALPAQDVKRILFYAPPQAMPQLPPWCPGFVTLAGELVPLVDLARLLGWPSEAPGLHSHMLLLRPEEQALLVLVSRVEQIVEVSPEQLRPLPPDRSLQGLMAAAWFDGEHSLPVLVPRLLLLKEERERIKFFERQLQARSGGSAAR